MFLSTNEQRTQLLLSLNSQLWQPNQSGQLPTVYAILDGARDKQIEKIIREGDLKSFCLYEGKLSYQMAVAAPYIVRLEANHPQTNEILLKGWGNSWGVFAVTFPPATLINVRHNCRKIARVKSPEGKNLIFRYYDPRVLRTYLPECNAQEANKVFGTITDFIVESENPEHLHRFRQTALGLLDVHGGESISTPLAESNLAKSAAITSPDKSHGLQITEQQMGVFEAVRFKQFIAEMELHLSTYFTSQTAALENDGGFSLWVKRNIKQAQTFGFITELDICRYLNVAIVQGEDVKEAGWLQEIIEQSLFPSTKATLLEEKSLQVLDQQHQEVTLALDDINQQILEQFYQKHHKKVLGIGVPLYDLSFTDEQALKDWMYNVGEQCIQLGLTDDMALDLWLDIAMRYGENFPKESWALLTETQKETLSPSETLFHLLAQQPHKNAAHA